mmetsp:Transcript_7717/g.14982  ORF Transcript_7717/g.14982 Transcript_7717/m.14982 type:complete len:86 (-) Transcript_7717:144-401(-)
MSTNTTVPMEANTEVRVETTGLCRKCQNKSITYQADPCGCPCFCTDCARKMATGGRCRACGDMFGGLRRIRAAEQEVGEDKPDEE